MTELLLITGNRTVTASCRRCRQSLNFEVLFKLCELCGACHPIENTPTALGVMYWRKAHAEPEVTLWLSAPETLRVASGTLRVEPPASSCKLTS